jgi:hypothetical protein
LDRAKKITFTNVASAPVSYNYQSGTDTANAQAAATAISNTGGSLYDASATGAVITLTAKTGGVIVNAPAAEAGENPIKNRAARRPPPGRHYIAVRPAFFQNRRT